MLAKQLSVFLENKSGRLTEVTEVLGRHPTRKELNGLKLRNK